MLAFYLTSFLIFVQLFYKFASERMLSLSHGWVLGFDLVFKTSEQALFNRLRYWSASKSGKDDSKDRDKHISLKEFMKSSQKWEEKERVSCRTGIW